MKAFVRVVSFGGGCIISGAAMAAPVPGPSPEIGDGVVGAVVAAVSLLAFVMLPRVKKMLQSNQG